MDSGVTEAEGYENFGRRCDLQIYIRLGALLSQNLRKGTKGLSELLKLESIQAFEERKARAKRLGEEAGIEGSFDGRYPPDHAFWSHPADVLSGSSHPTPEGG